MYNRLVKVATLEYIAGTPGTPYRPPYCVTTQVPVSGSSGSRAAFGVTPIPEDTYNAWFFPPPPTLGGTAGGGGSIPDDAFGVTPVPADPFSAWFFPPPPTRAGVGTASAGNTQSIIVDGVAIPSGYSGNAVAPGDYWGSPTPPPPPPPYPVPSGGGTKEVITCYPAVEAVPPVPGRTVSRDVLGWDGGARSVRYFVGTGFVSFEVDAASYGVLCGLSDGQNVHSFGHASHAFLVEEGQVSIVEAGETIAAIGTHAAGDVFAISVDEGSATYRVNGALVYESSLPVAGASYLDATFWAPGDAVFNPVIGGLVPAQVVMEGDHQFIVDMTQGIFFDADPRVLVVATASNAERSATVVTDGSGGTSGNGGAPGGNGGTSPGSASSSVRSDTSGYMLVNHTVYVGRVVVIAGDGEITVAPGSWWLRAHAPLIAGFFSETSAPAWVNAGAPAPTGFFTQSVAGPLLSGVASSPSTPVGAFVLHRVDDDPLVMRPPAPTAFLSESDEAMVMSGRYALNTAGLIAEDPYKGGGNYWEMSPLIALGHATLGASVLLTVADGIELNTEAVLTVIIDEELEEVLLAGDGGVASLLMNLHASDMLAIGSALSTTEDAVAQYAVHSDTGALSRYEDFGYHGFVRDGDTTWAWDRGGVYRIGDEEAVTGAIDFGAEDFGAPQLKHLHDVFVGVATDGEVYLRAGPDDGPLRTYRVLGTGEEKRARVGRGLRARRWRLQLEIVGASQAELLDVEFNVQVSGRRQGRRV